MSVETLVLLALFILLPLIQQLIRATRQRSHRLPKPTEMRPPGTLASTPPPDLAAPPLDTTAHPPPDATPATPPVPAPHAGGRVTTTLTAHRATGQRTAVGLRTRRELRRAIVLVAIVGPCRASSSYRSACDVYPLPNP